MYDGCSASRTLNNLEKVIATVEMKMGRARGVGSHAGLGGSHL